MITLQRVRESLSRAASAMILVVLAAPSLPAAEAPSAGEPIAADTAGTVLLEWSYDMWSVPWVQVTRESKLPAGSCVTPVALACENASLERDRKARHLSREDCEHRIAAIRAEHDTALIFRVHIRVLDRARASELVRMGSRVRALLEDDHGWQWGPRDMRRGAALGMATEQKVKRVYQYHPQWDAGSGLRPRGRVPDEQRHGRGVRGIPGPIPEAGPKDRGTDPYARGGAREHLRRHWEVLRTAQFKDPAFGFLSTLEKANEGDTGMTRPDATPEKDEAKVADEWLEIRVSGLECATCARRLALHVRACPGVDHAIANPQTGVLRVRFRPEDISEVNLMVEIRRAGFIPGAEQLRLGVKGMHCRSCARAIERAVREHCPVERVCARHEAGEVLVDFLPGRSNPAAIAAAVEALGYRVESMETTPSDSE